MDLWVCLGSAVIKFKIWAKLLIPRKVPVLGKNMFIHVPDCISSVSLIYFKAVSASAESKSRCRAEVVIWLTMELQIYV